MHRLCALAVILVASPAAASDGPPFAVGLDYTVAYANAFETWKLGWRLEAGLFFRTGHWQATGSASAHLGIEPSRPERDSDAMFGYGVGARIAYHVPIDRGSFYIAAGFERLWFDGDAEVQRNCRYTGACLAGYYPERPAYNAWAPQLRLGIGPHTHQPTVHIAGAFELIVEPIALRDVPPAGIKDIALYAAFTFSVGFGPKR
jgi:hypothetical protein